jgi:hypothetical protein
MDIERGNDLLVAKHVDRKRRHCAIGSDQPGRSQNQVEVWPSSGAGLAPTPGQSSWQKLCVTPPAEGRMLLMLVVLCLILWALGMMTTYTLGGVLHILLVFAVVFLLIRVIRGQPV